MLLGNGSQAVYARRLATNPRTGTTRRAMLRQLRAAGKTLNVQASGTLGRLARATPALVNYREVDGEDHYAIVLRVTKRFVVLHDPWHGPNYRLPVATFTAHWKNPKLRKKYTGWFVQVA